MRATHNIKILFVLICSLSIMACTGAFSTRAPSSSDSTQVDDGVDSVSSNSPVIFWKSPSVQSSSSIYSTGFQMMQAVGILSEEEYEVCLGSEKSKCDVSSWNNVGTSYSYEYSSLTLVAGTKYYASVRPLGSTSSSEEMHGDGFTVVSSGTTPQAPAVVYDDEQSPLNNSPLIEWTSSKVATGTIIDYEVAIGTSSGARNIVSWTSTSGATSYMFSGLNLTAGTKYYATVRAKANSGLYSTAQNSDGWLAVTKYRFDYTGSLQPFVVPTGITSMTVKLWGAGGGAGFGAPIAAVGGAGAFVTDTLTGLTPGETLQIIVGQGGFSGGSDPDAGGPSYGAFISGAGGYGGGGNATLGAYSTCSGGGGGRSAIQRAGDDLITAGGGGGGSRYYDGGPGGVPVGGDSSVSLSSLVFGNSIYAGIGGGISIGGDGGVGNDMANAGNSGSMYVGGAGSSDGSAGGGGGYYGGGGGGSETFALSFSSEGGGGGGGSSHYNLGTGTSSIGASSFLSGGSSDSNFAGFGQGALIDNVTEVATGFDGTNGYHGNHGAVFLEYGTIAAPKCAAKWTTAGTYSWTVPAGCSDLIVRVWGAGGGGQVFASGGSGGFVKYPVKVTAGEVLTIVVGSGGTTQTDVTISATGGGFSAIQRGANYIAIAGGGGGGGANYGGYGGGGGGRGGGVSNADFGGSFSADVAAGVTIANGVSGGDGGTSLAPGAGSIAHGGGSATDGSAGVGMVGGAGGTGAAAAGGSGGSGYFGGGGAGGDELSFYNLGSAGGGGGSNLVPAGGIEQAGKNSRPGGSQDVFFNGTSGVGGNASQLQSSTDNGHDGAIVIRGK